MKNARASAPPSRQIISRALREAIENSGMSASSLAERSGVARRAIDRFLAEERDVRLDSVDRLAEALGLRLVETGRARARPSHARGGSPRDRERPRATTRDDGDRMDAGEATTAEDRP